MSLLSTQDLSIAVGSARINTEKILCRDLSVQFNGGENWVILGPNGCGKTTLLHTLAGLRAPTSGTVLLRGKDITCQSYQERALQIGILFQHTDVVFPASVMETTLTGRHPHITKNFFSSLWQWESTEDKGIAARALDEVGLDGLTKRSANTLSGGERRRMEIATLLTQDPPICLLDEPNNDLDLNYQLKMLSLLSKRADKPEHMNIFVLHDVNMALRFCSHGLLLFDNGTILHGALQEMLDTNVLEQLYHCPFRMTAIQDQQLYVPG